MPDNAGYPTDDELARIQYFTGSKREWFNLIRAAWWMPDWGWTETEEMVGVLRDTPGTRLHISTGGWSGNESIISAMLSNDVLWMMTWVSTRRGGHYEFEIDAP